MTQAALDSGVEIEYGANIEGMQDLLRRGNTASFDIVIAADGKGSSLRRESSIASPTSRHYRVYQMRAVVISISVLS